MVPVLVSFVSLLAGGSLLWSVLLGLLAWVALSWPQPTNMSLGADTVALLTTKDEAEEDCAAVVNALVSSPFTEDQDECAEQIRAVVLGKHLTYKSLATKPSTLLAASRHFATSSHGALLTRFTVQYNLYAGSIVALGNEEQREQLFATQDAGELGCFAFTECGAGVMSGAGVETVATYDPETETFAINSPTLSSRKNWISQGLYAERAVILAELRVGSTSYGPHLFWARIAHRDEDGRAVSVPGVTVSPVAPKVALRGLDNAIIDFTDFHVPRSALLSRFVTLKPDGQHAFNLPSGTKRMVDLLISRLLTGRICLSDYNVNYATTLMRHCWKYVEQRELWRGSKLHGKKMSQMSLVRCTFRDWTRTLAVVNNFIRETRERVVRGIALDEFTADVVERTCICKYVGTSVGVDAVSTLRKTLGSAAMLEENRLGADTFVANATCAAEGDNTVMELKIVGDLVRGRTAMAPANLLLRVCTTRQGRTAAAVFAHRMVSARMLGRNALKEGQLLRDLAWARAHLLIVDAWRRQTRYPQEWLSAYERVLMRFPVPTCH